MTRSIPIIPTILVVAAAGVMVWLGFWQLGRADEKAELIAEFEQMAAQSEVADIEVGEEELAYRTVRLPCEAPKNWQAIAGRNIRGQSGYAHRYLCSRTTVLVFDAGTEYTDLTYADIGWSTSPAEPDFKGGVIEGVLVRMGDDFKVVAGEPLAGLAPLAKPDPNDLPNNHLAYAGQWFFFALTALVIYGFALKSRAGKRD